MPTFPGLTDCGHQTGVMQSMAEIRSGVRSVLDIANDARIDFSDVERGVLQPTGDDWRVRCVKFGARCEGKVTSLKTIGVAARQFDPAFGAAHLKDELWMFGRHASKDVRGEHCARACLAQDTNVVGILPRRRRASIHNIRVRPENRRAGIDVHNIASQGLNQVERMTTGDGQQVRARGYVFKIKILVQSDRAKALRCGGDVNRKRLADLSVSDKNKNPAIN
jgi:hypothetical protein